MNRRAFAKLALSLAALASLPDPAHASMRVPFLVVPPGMGQPIETRRVQIRTEVAGGVAQTTVEMEFYNPNPRVMEGELQFPLASGQEVVGFALDIDGRLRDAVPIEKARGQEVFEDIVRRGVDPGLLSATQGNNYKLRVYPLFAQRSRHVMVRYVEALPQERGQYLLRLPVEYAAVREFSLQVRNEGRVVRELAHREYHGRGALEMRFPAATTPRTFVEERNGRRFFLAEIPASSAKLRRALPSRIDLLWDSSLSGAERNHQKEYALLDAYFRAVRNAEVRLVRLRDRAELAGTYVVRNGFWRELRSALEQTTYDGATRLDDAPQGWAQERLLFSDGLANFGRPAGRQDAPLYAVNSSVKADTRLLARIAHESGGRLVDLTAERTRIAAEKLLLAEESLVAVAADGATALAHESPFAAGGRFLVAGELLSAAATLHLSLRGADGQARETRVRLSGGETRSGLAAVSWARMRIAALEADPAVHRAEIERIGRQFGLVTRNTSLIVLEFVRDYARYGIEPPQELRAEYEHLLAQGVRPPQAPSAAQNIERVVALYRERQAWWEREYPKGELPARIGDSGSRDRSLEFVPQAGELRREMAASSPAAPAPLLAAGASKARAADDAGGEARIARPARIATWSSASGQYLARLRGVDPDKLYAVYLDERPGHRASPAFYADVADHLFQRGRPELAQRVLSNLAEIDLENRHYLRLLAHRLAQAQRWDLALALLERVLELAPEEPQSWRDLALAHARLGNPQRAVDLLYEVASRSFNHRFPNIGLVAAVEMNQIIAAASAPLDTSRIDPRLLKNLPLDLRVVLSWDADGTDLDLVVTDPNGQRAFWHQPTYQGGRLSANYAMGYGPEEFALRNAKPGTYRIEVRYSSDRRQVLPVPPTAQVRVYRRYGTAQQTEQVHSIRFERRGEMRAVGELAIPGNDG